MLRETTSPLTFPVPALLFVCSDGRLSQFRGFTVPLWSLLSLTARSLLVTKAVSTASVSKAKAKKKKAATQGKGGGGSTANPFAALMDG